MRRTLINEKGIALFLVLWVLVLLSVIVGEFCHAMRTEVNITRNFKEKTQAYYIALAGLNRAISELIREVTIPQEVKAPDSEGEVEEEEKSRWRVNAEIPAIPFGQGEFKVKIGNESGKININRANEAMLNMMLDGFDLEEHEKNIIVDSIMDWRDKDNLHRLNGAEDDYYKSLPDAYECKDGDFDSIEELVLVRGVTPEIFYGGLEDMVTVFEYKRSSRGGKRYERSISKIDINAASSGMLLALPLMTDGLVQEIMEYRKESAFRLMSDVESVVGSEVFKAIMPYITLETSPFYTIESVGNVKDSQVRQGVEALVEINLTLKRGFRVLQWQDTLRYPKGQSSLPHGGKR